MACLFGLPKPAVPDGPCRVALESPNEVSVSPSVEIRVFEPPYRAELCRFRTDRPMLPGASGAWEAAHGAEGHWLFTRLLAMEGIDSVGAEHDEVVVSKSDHDLPWKPIVEKGRELIEEFFTGGHAPLVEVVEDGDASAEEQIRVSVEKVFADVVNPGVSQHGGWVRLVGVTGSRVQIEMGGGCQGCSASALTIQTGVRRAILSVAPQVTEVQDITDHSAGTVPFLP
jgi:Fe-S cluster biogenesis protein NfuA